MNSLVKRNAALWVVIGLHLLVSSIDGQLVFGTIFGINWFVSPDWRSSLLRGLVLSQLVLVAAWAALATSPWRAPWALATGMGSLFIWLLVSHFTYWDYGSRNMVYVRPWLLFTALVLGGALWMVCVKAREKLGWEIASPGEPVAPRPRVGRSAGLGHLLFWAGGIVVALLLAWRLADPFSAWVVIIDEAGPLRVGRDLLFSQLQTACLLLPGFFSLGAMLHGGHRRPWAFAALSAVALISLAGLLGKWGGSYKLEPFYKWRSLLEFELGVCLGVVGSLSILAACGWRLGSAGVSASFTLEGRGWVGFARRNALLFMLVCLHLGGSLCIPRFALIAIENSGLLFAVLVGLLSSQVALAALWISLAAAPLRVRWPSGLGLLLVSFFAFSLATRDLSYGFELIGSWPVLVAVLVVVGALLVPCSLVRWRTGWSIGLPKMAREARYGDQQFGIRDLLLWTAGVALLLVVGKWVLVPLPEGPHWLASAWMGYCALLLFGYSLPALLCFGWVLHAGRRVRWFVAAVVMGIVVISTFVFSYVMLSGMSRMGLDGWLTLGLYELGLCSGVTGTLVLLAAGGWRLDRGPRGGKLAVGQENCDNCETSPSGPTTAGEEARNQADASLQGEGSDR